MHNSQKLCITILFSLIPTYAMSMLSTWKHEPFLAPDNEYIRTMRRDLARYKKTEIKIAPYPNVQIKRVATEDEKNRRCGYFALKKTTGSLYFRHFVAGNPQYTSLDVERYFEQVKIPEPGMLVVYTKSKNDLTILHYGVVTKNLKVKSKWGSYLEIMESYLFENPYNFGDAAGYFALKPIYRTESGIAILQLELYLANHAIETNIRESKNAIAYW